MLIDDRGRRGYTKNFSLSRKRISCALILQIYANICAICTWISYKNIRKMRKEIQTFFAEGEGDS